MKYSEQTKKTYLENLNESREESKKHPKPKKYGYKKINNSVPVKKDFVEDNDGSPETYKSISQQEFYNRMKHYSSSFGSNIFTTASLEQQLEKINREIRGRDTTDEALDDLFHEDIPISHISTSSSEIDPATTIKEPQEKEIEYPTINSINERVARIYFTRKVQLRYSKITNFSCGVGIFGDIEELYRRYGIDTIITTIDYILNEFNSLLNKNGHLRIRFAQFSVTDRYEELVKYFYKVAHTATDFEPNPNSDNRISVFTLKVNK